MTRIFVDDAVCVALGKTREEIGKMKLDEFTDLVLDRGYDIEVGPIREAADGEGRLCVVMAERSEQLTR